MPAKNGKIETALDAIAEAIRRLKDVAVTDERAVAAMSELTATYERVRKLKK